MRGANHGVSRAGDEHKYPNCARRDDAILRARERDTCRGRNILRAAVDIVHDVDIRRGAVHGVARSECEAFYGDTTFSRGRADCCRNPEVHNDAGKFCLTTKSVGRGALFFAVAVVYVSD